jgi:hypothetical protein
VAIEEEEEDKIVLNVYMHLLVLSSYRMTAVFPGETEMEMIFTVSYVVRNVKQK